MPKKKTTKASDVHQPDDKLFKAAMSRKESVESYLETFHPEVAQTLDFKTLKSVNETFLSSSLKTFAADIIWKCRLKNSKKETYISFLWEHKMQKEKNYSIQLGLYIFMYLNRLVNIEKKPIQPILPLLFYNGKDAKWKPPTLHQLFADLPGFESIKQYIPYFEPLFVNLTGTSESTIQKIAFSFLKSSFLSMFWIRDENLLIKKISFIFETDDEIGATQLVAYIAQKMNRPPLELKQILEKSDIPNKKLIMSTYDQMMEPLIKEIEEKEKFILFEKEKAFFEKLKMIKEMSKEGFSIEVIARLHKVEQKYVKAVLNEKIKSMEDSEKFKQKK